MFQPLLTLKHTIASNHQLCTHNGFKVVALVMDIIVTVQPRHRSNCFLNFISLCLDLESVGEGIVRSLGTFLLTPSSTGLLQPQRLCHDVQKFFDSTSGSAAA